MACGSSAGSGARNAACQSKGSLPEGLETAERLCREGSVPAAQEEKQGGAPVLTWGDAVGTACDME